MKKNFIDILYEKRKIIIITGLIILVGVSLYFVIAKKVNEASSKSNEKIVTTTLKIFGPQKISLKTGEEYDEPGYYAIDSSGKIKSDDVKVSSDFDKNNPGTYTITYEIDGKTLTRDIEVTGEAIDENNQNENKSLEISLNGEKVITLSLGEEYVEPGFIALSPKEENINSKVLVSGEVDTTKPGEYTLTYSVEYNDEKKEVIRTIVVLDDTLKLSITPNKTNYTNSPVALNVKIEGNNFETLVLPNNVTYDNKEANYSVTTNGDYTFTAYNVNGKAFSKTITITNIDTEKPTGVCTTTINPTSTTIQVNGSDEVSGIENYVYYDNATELLKSTNSFYNYNQKTSKSVYVTILDKAQNSNKITCNIIDNSALM